MAKILVIDDEPVVRALLEILLSEQGYDVVLADGGWKGLDLYRRERPAPAHERFTLKDLYQTAAGRTC